MTPNRFALASGRVICLAFCLAHRFYQTPANACVWIDEDHLLAHHFWRKLEGHFSRMMLSGPSAAAQPPLHGRARAESPQLETPQFGAGSGVFAEGHFWKRCVAGTGLSRKIRKKRYSLAMLAVSCAAGTSCAAGKHVVIRRRSIRPVPPRHSVSAPLHVRAVLCMHCSAGRWRRPRPDRCDFVFALLLPNSGLAILKRCIGVPHRSGVTFVRIDGFFADVSISPNSVVAFVRIDGTFAGTSISPNSGPPFVRGNT